MASPLEGFGYGLAGGASGTALGYLAQTQLASQQQQYYRENMKKSFGYSQLAQKLAPTNVKQGLVMAGMSPALATEARFSPAQSPSAPLGSNSIGLPNVNVSESMLALAQAKKSDAEADAINIRNNQERNADDVSKLLSDVYFKKLSEVARSPEEKARYESLASVARNKGAFGLLDTYIGMLDKKELYDLDYQEYLVRKNTAWLQNNADNGNIILDIARIPSNNRKFLEEQIRKIGAEIENLNKQKDLTIEEKNLKIAQMNLTNQEIENLKEVASNLRNTNIMKMIDDGEYGKALISTILMLLGNLSGSVSKKF